MLTAMEVIDRVRVIDILAAHGVERPKRGTRVRCPIHGGLHNTFSYNEQKGIWHCFACHEGGGKIALVRRLLSCEPRAALEWLADLAGVPLANWTREQMQARAASLHQAEFEGRALVEWRNELIDRLRLKRECIQIVYWMAIRQGRTKEERELWAAIRDLDQKIDWHEQASWDLLVHVFRDSLSFQGVSR